MQEKNNLIAHCFLLIVFVMTVDRTAGVHFVSKEFNNTKWPWPFASAPKVPISLPQNDLPVTSAPVTRNNGAVRGEIHASIIPAVYNTNQSILSDSSSKEIPRVEVKILATKNSNFTSRKPVLHGLDRDFISFSSNVMNVDHPLFIPKTDRNRRRHSAVHEKRAALKRHQIGKNGDLNDKHFPADSHAVPIRPRLHLPTENTAVFDSDNCISCDKQDGRNRARNSKKKQRVKLRLPVRAMLYESSGSTFGDVGNLRKILQPLKPITISKISRNSPTRLLIPIWRGDVVEDNGHCIRCPVNKTYVAKRGESTVKLPIPMVSICPRLARSRGILNLAVTQGPRPGTELQAGQYHTELIAWKIAGQVYSCEYTITIKVLHCPEMEASKHSVATCTKSTLWGSQCSFSCVSKEFVSKGSPLTFCEGTENGVSWTAHPPTCHKVPEVKTSPLKSLCKKLENPSGGTVACNGANGASNYTEGSVCQFFCFPGHLISPVLSSNGIVVCRNGEWMPRNKFACLKKTVPQPDANDCQNTTILANRKGKAFIKKPNFYHPGNNKKASIQVSCNYSGEVKAGFYINHCAAYDSEFDVTGYCSYSIVVKERSCTPPKSIPHGSFRCFNTLKSSSSTLYPPHAVCEYFCATGYVIPLRQRKWRKRKCSSKLKWNKNKVPVCKKAVAPRPRPNDCRNVTLYLKNGQKYVNWNFPRFRTSHKKRKARVQCSLNNTLSAGIYTNICEATDPDLGLTSTCSYNISVKTEGCSFLPNVSLYELQCTVSETPRGYPISTECSYVCHLNYTIPTSELHLATKMCTPQGEWNSTGAPSCVENVLPQATESSCQNFNITTDDFTNFTLPSQTFKTFSNRIIEANCTYEDIHSFGTYNISCTAYDDELRLADSCKFILRITKLSKKEEENSNGEFCSALTEVEYGSYHCTPSKNANGHPVSSVCTFTCIPEYTVPLSQQPLISKLCTSPGRWNNSETPTCQRRDPPKVLDHGCFDQVVTAETGNYSSLIYPEFFTDRNTSAVVTCTNLTISDTGIENITCLAIDPELNTTATCSFKVSVLASETTTLDSVIDCKSLTAPTNGYANCTSERGSQYECEVKCADGFSFPSNYPLLQQGLVTCDRTDGFWDFERLYNVSSLPDCLHELPTTSVEVWLGFKAAVENCDDDHIFTLKSAAQASLLEMNQEVCRSIDCNATFEVNCTFDETKNRLSFDVLWKIQAAFDPKEYEGSKEVPLVETQIESVLETTQKSITTEKDLKEYLLNLGAELWQDSYRRGHIILICQERGFVVDTNSDKCIECPSGTYEVDGKCQSCGTGFYQLRSGQTSCEPCSKVSGTLPQSACNGT